MNFENHLIKIPEEWTKVQLAYMAGLIDGEGCISFHFIRPSNGNMSFTSDFTINNTDKTMMRWVYNIFGGRWCPERWGLLATRQIYRIHFNHEQALPILSAVLPYIVAKKRQIEIVLEYLNHRQQYPHTPLEMKPHFISLVSEMHKIKHGIV